MLIRFEVGNVKYETTGDDSDFGISLGYALIAISPDCCRFNEEVAYAIVHLCENCQEFGEENDDLRQAADRRYNELREARVALNTREEAKP